MIEFGVYKYKIAHHEDISYVLKSDEFNCLYYYVDKEIKRYNFLRSNSLFFPELNYSKWIFKYE